MVGTDVVLAGPPSDLSGLVPFTNDTAASVVIEDIGVEAPDDPAASGRVAVEPLTVPPGASVRIRLRLAVDATSEPGSYPLELDVGSQRVEATAVVVAAPAVRVTPTVVVLDAVLDEAVVATVVVVNEGNVPVHLPAELSVSLHREDRALRTVGALVRDGPDDLALVESLPDEPAGQLTAALEGHGEVAPGTTTVLTCTFTASGDPPASERLVGALALATRTVLLVVPPTGPRPTEPT